MDLYLKVLVLLLRQRLLSNHQCPESLSGHVSTLIDTQIRPIFYFNFFKINPNTALWKVNLQANLECVFGNS